MADERKLHIYGKLNWASMGIGALSIILPMVFWKSIPDKIPMHYNAKGVVDNWADKANLVLLFFVIGMLMGLMAIAVYFVKSGMKSKYSKEDEKTEYMMVYPLIIIMNFAMQCIFAYITFCVVTCRPLGKLFLPIGITSVFIPVCVMLYENRKLKSLGREQNRQYKDKESNESGITYRTAVDLWLGILLGGCEVLMLGLFLWPLITEGKFEWLMIILFIVISILLVPLFGIKYILYSEHLLITMGWYVQVRVKYEDITKVEKTMNPLSSAAMSLRRVEIRYMENGVHKFVLISPVKRKEFMEEVEKRRNRNGAID